MNRVKEIFIYIIIICVIIVFFLFKVIKSTDKINKITDSAIHYAESIYVDKSFDMKSWNYIRENQEYSIVLVDVDNKNSVLYCQVNANIKNGEFFYVRICGGRNIERRWE